MHHSDAIIEVVILLSAAVLVVPLFRMMKMSTILGYLVAGLVIGPSGLALVENSETITAIAEFGVVFLLFLIGIELNLERIKELKKYVLGLGTLQIAITGAIISIISIWIAQYFGNELSNETAVIIGGAMALSSTAVVLQSLAEKNQLQTYQGKLAVAILICQDFAVVPLMVLVPLLAGQDDTSLIVALGSAFLRAIAVMAAIWLVGRVLFRPLFRIISNTKSAELFSATTLLIVIGAAWITSHLGLSPALGAFLAGLLVSETEYHHQVEADITPFKGLCLGLFFMSVGMYIDFDAIWEWWDAIIIITIALIIGKAIILFVLAKLFAVRTAPAIHNALMLSQGGEFALVLFGVAISHNLLDEILYKQMIGVIALSMALTPFLSWLGKTIANHIDLKEQKGSATKLEETAHLMDKHIIIAGFGRVGQMVARFAEEENLSYVALDVQARNIASHRTNGKPVFYGNAAMAQVWRVAGASHAKCAIITLDDTNAAIRAVAALRLISPTIPVIVRASDLSCMPPLSEAGADMVVPESYEASLQIGAALLNAIGTSDDEVKRVITCFRNEIEQNSIDLSKN